MSDSNVRERLQEKHEGDRARRVEGIKRWVEYSRNEPPSTWGPQQNAIVDAQLAAARHVQTTATHKRRVADVAEAIRQEREDGDDRS